MWCPHICFPLPLYHFLALSQVSTNLEDFEQTPPHAMYEACARVAAECGAGVCGCELIGLVPKRALLMAAEYYAQRDKLLVVEESQQIKLAANRLVRALSQSGACAKVVNLRLRETPK